MKKALSYLLIFIGLQIVGGGIITILWNVIDNSRGGHHNHRHLPLDTLCRGVAQVVAHTSLDGTYLERRGSNGSHHTLHVDTGANARTAQLCRTGV